MKSRNTRILAGLAMLGTLSAVSVSAAPPSLSGSAISSSGSVSTPDLVPIHVVPPFRLVKSANGHGTFAAPSIVKPYPGLQPRDAFGHFVFSATQTTGVATGQVAYWVTRAPFPAPHSPVPPPVLLRIDGTMAGGIITTYAPDGGEIVGSGPAVLRRPGLPPISGTVTIEAFDVDSSSFHAFDIEFYQGYFGAPLYYAQGAVPDSWFSNIEIDQAVE